MLVSGQSAEKRARDKALCDSIINNPESADTSLAKAYIMLAKILAPSNIDTMVPLSNKGIMHAEMVIANTNIDSLKVEMHLKRADAFNNIGYVHYIKGDVEKALSMFEKSLSIYVDHNQLKDASAAYINIGAINNHLGNSDVALSYYKKGAYYDSLQNGYIGRAASYNNIASIYQARNDYQNAILYHTKSLHMREQENDEVGMAISYHNIGSIYNQMEEYDASLRFERKALKLNKRLDNHKGIAENYRSIGGIYENLEMYDSTGHYYYQSLAHRKRVENNQGMAATLKAIGLYHMKINQPDSAKEYFRKALLLLQKVQDKDGEADALASMARLHNALGEYSLAAKYALDGFLIAKAIKDNSIKRKAAEQLYISHKAMGNKAKAFDYYETFITLRDSAESLENQKVVMRQMMQYDYEKKVEIDSIKTAEDKKVTDAQLAAQQAEIKQAATVQYALYGGLALLLIFGGFMYNRYRVTQRQKGIIETQKAEVEQQKKEADHQREIVEEKNREIVDSINYASRLQQAILPPKTALMEHLPNSFVYYQPKDIVAGDFYWMETVGDTVFFAAADCTGHGVPGAMVSVVCSNALTKAVIEENILEPAAILDRTRELVIERFAKSDEEVKDGMDISLCAWNKTTNQLQWSGANNPLWIVNPNRSNIPEIGLPFAPEPVGFEIKPDKQPIGTYAISKPFTNHRLQLEQGDMLYLFSDGYVDQFGGVKGKKYKAANLRKLLTLLYPSPIAEQRRMLEEKFIKWRGEYEQIDDVCVMGVRV